VGEGTNVRRDAISPTRVLIGAGLIGGCYLALPWLMFGGASVSGWLLLGSALVGAAVGASRGAMESKRPARRCRARGPATSTGAFVVGTTGSALLLGRFLDASSVPWLLLGMVALTTGAAAHARLAPKQADSR
jgi:hypothetical protein